MAEADDARRAPLVARSAYRRQLPAPADWPTVAHEDRTPSAAWRWRSPASSPTRPSSSPSRARGLGPLGPRPFRGRRRMPSCASTRPGRRLKPRLDEIARAAGFPGAIVVLGEPDCRPGDCARRLGRRRRGPDPDARPTSVDDIVQRLSPPKAGTPNRLIDKPGSQGLDHARPVQRRPRPDELADTTTAALRGRGADRGATDLDSVFDVPVNISAVLGRASLRSASSCSSGRARCSSSTARSARPSTSTSTTAWWRAARSSSSTTLGVTMTEIIKGDK